MHKSSRSFNSDKALQERPGLQASRLRRFDLRHFDDDDSLCAILLPVSPSAIHSTELKENNSHLAYVSRRDAYELDLREVARNDSREEPNIDAIRKGNKTRGKGRQPVLIFKRSRSSEKFTLGLGQGCDVILKHLEADVESLCYVNQNHAELYPDPDSECLVLRNVSATSFVAAAEVGVGELEIKSKEDAKLRSGVWSLTLGEGLIFEMLILRSWVSLTNGLISSSSGTRVRPMAKGKSTKRVHFERSSSPLQMAEPPPKWPEKSGAAQKLSEKEKSDVTESSHPTNQKGKGEEAPLKSVVRPSKTESAPQHQRPSSQEEDSQQALPETIVRTRKTEVLKLDRGGAAVAVKRCRKANPVTSAREWRKEVEILRALSHPHIVRLIKSDAIDLSLEMEYVGQDLEKLSDNRRMSQAPLEQGELILRHVAKGLEFLCDQKIVHRDVKPANILLSENGARAVICDFGLAAKVLNEPEPYNGGTPSYVPPEFLTDAPRGYEGDIWALGITMLFVFGRVPLPSGCWLISKVASDLRAREEMVQWLQEVREVLRHLPAELNLLRKLLTEDPYERVTASVLVKQARGPALKAEMPA